jgi:hypothetical protein
VCTAYLQCTGKTFEGLGGESGALGGIGDLMKLVEGIKTLKDLFGGGDEGGGGGASTGVGGTAGCVQYSPVSVPTSNPCEYYVPPVSGQLGSTTSSGAGDALLNALGGLNSGVTTNPVPISDRLTQTQAPTPTSTAQSGGIVTVTKTETGIGTTVPSNPNLVASGRLTPGLQGDIAVTNTSARITAKNRDTASNSEVAGFYGTVNPTLGGSTSFGARICQARPWSGLISYVIPASFFDSLCERRGYSTKKTVSPPVQTPTTPRTQAPTVAPAPKPKTATTTVATTTTVTTYSGPPGVADVWAVPAAVPIGSRTSIFWNTKNVASCTVTSPDGSFNEKSLSGGASTVPLSGPTTFSISCIGLDGKPATDFVTVKMAL